MTLLDTLLPIGFTRLGTPVFPRRGGSPVGEGEEQGAGGGGGGGGAEEQKDDDAGQGDPDDDESGSEDEDGEEDGDEELGAGGKKALADTRKERDRYKGRAKEARDALKPWSDLGKEFGLKPDEVRARLQGKVKDAEGKEVDVEALRREVESKVRGEFSIKLAGAQLKTLAADVLMKADDAVKFLDVSDFDIDDKGNLDADEVKTALAELIEERPYLAKTTAVTKVRKPSGGKGQGSGKGGDGKPVGSVAAGMELWKQTGSKTKV